MEKRAESESTSIRCVLRVTIGSAQISTIVRSGPMPASESATATLRLAGNPVAGLLGAPYLLEHKIEIDDIKEPLKIFSGTAREAAKGFPANLNVAVALSLAGIGPDRTMVEIWADPMVTRNTHRIEVDSDSARFSKMI